MKTQPILTLLLTPLLVALAGCVTYPISKPLREQSRRVTLAQVLQDPDAVRGTTVIWGGRIIETVNDTNGATIYVLVLPLDRYETPDPDAIPVGRFIGRSKQFLEPESLRQGQLVTVAGTIVGVEVHKLQQTEYRYPVLDLREVHLWQVKPYPYYGGWGWYYPYGYWDYPGWGPGWGGYYYRPYPYQRGWYRHP